jgi:hypothetical protein
MGRSLADSHGHRMRMQEPLVRRREKKYAAFPSGSAWFLGCPCSLSCVSDSHPCNF